MDSASTHDFASKARSFIDWCSTSHARDSKKTMKLQALQQLSEIYVAGLRLPDTDFAPAPQPPSQTETDRAQLADNLGSLPFQYYWKVFTPASMKDEDKEPVCGDLFDDFLDICGDLASGLWLYDQGHSESAAFHWLQMFEVHWGRHAVSAMHALHSFDPDA